MHLIWCAKLICWTLSFSHRIIAFPQKSTRLDRSIPRLKLPADETTFCISILDQGEDMSVSRREFLLRGGILAAGVVLPVTALAQQSTPSGPAKLGGPTDISGANALTLWSKASFLACVGSEFAVQQSENQKVYLVLN